LETENKSTVKKKTNKTGTFLIWQSTGFQQVKFGVISISAKQAKDLQQIQSTKKFHNCFF